MNVRQQAFTLVELMLVTVLLGVLITGVMQFFTTQKKNASVTTQVVEIQQNSRLLGDLFEEDIRHAGLLVPESGALCAVDGLLVPDSFFVSDADAIDSTDEIRNDLGARIQGGGVNIVGGTTQNLLLDTLVVEFTTPDAAYDTDADGVADSDFRVGGGVIVTDAGNPIRGAACGLITAVALGGPGISVTMLSGALAVLPGGASPVDLVAIPAHAYSINAASQLIRDGSLIANDVEDLQIAVFIDTNTDRTVDVGEYRGDGVGPDFDPSTVDISNTREIRANLVLRTRINDLDNTNGRFQDAENRAAIAGADGFRRRTYRATVGLRNVGSRIPTS
jgi:prepilin-type N-terminal cleavage/methylation domain-containing protein